MSDDFVVNDKRLFGKDGQIQPGTEEESRPSAPEAEAAAQTSAPAGEQSASSAMPPANFAGLLLGLATSAFIHLGEGPEGGEGQVDLAAAKHAIDLLGVLKVKTQGNLEKEEESLLTTLLYDLRMQYVKASKK